MAIRKARSSMGEWAFPKSDVGRKLPIMEARCQCGELTARCESAGAGVMCHCKSCQRRSGSPFGMMVYFDADAVEMHGKATEYTRAADSGNAVTHGFCPTCGTPFYLKTDKHPGGIGVAIGVIDQPEMYPPLRSVYEQDRYEWVTTPIGTQHFPRGRDS